VFQFKFLSIACVTFAHSLVSIDILVFAMLILSFLLCLSLKESMEEEDVVNVVLDNVVVVVGENTLGLNKNPIVSLLDVENVLDQ